ncbi:hypothetical protein AWC19_27770 [Mycobacterium palustre]|uniref:Outer membrane protein n=2 Tax=Mycobacterium palustre TaxID=153971 RepID=A0A1X1ZVJ6_9MYCO|nr:hypothetical protein AWC19_27770 [Mycobacterium palustre]
MAGRDSRDDEAAQTDHDGATDISAGHAQTRSNLRRLARRTPWAKIAVYGVLPVIAAALTAGSGYLKWQESSARGSQQAGVEALTAARESVVAMLSYKADTVDKDLKGAENRLTGKFRDSYTHLINDVVIPGAKRDNITAVASAPAAAVASASMNRVVVVVFVDQTTTVGTGPPSDTASSVKVTLDKIGGQWLISDFLPV